MDRLSARTIEDIYELSPAQEGMLFHSVAAPDAGMYLVQLRCRLEGAPDGPALARIWQQVVDRHAVLRTSFHWREAEKPLQVVHRRARLPFQRQDWREMPPAVQERALAAFLAADRARGFALAEPPLTRVALFRLDDRTDQVVWSLHHLVLDGWSLALLMEELQLRLRAFDQGREVVLPPPRPYAEYVGWLQRQEQSASRAYWRRALAGPCADAPLVLGPAPARPEHGQPAADCRTALSVESTAALAALARRWRLTASTIVQGAWAILLGQYSGRAEVVFGATVSGRPADLPGVDSMVGMFVNTLPVRVELSAAAALAPWLARLQERQAELRQHQHTPLTRIQRWIGQPPRRPLFESAVVFENYPVGAAPTGGLAVGEVDAVERTNYALTLVVGPGDRLALKLLYDADRIEASMAARLLDHLVRLLEAIAAAPERLGDLPSPPPDERWLRREGAGAPAARGDRPARPGTVERRSGLPASPGLRPTLRVPRVPAPGGAGSGGAEEALESRLARIWSRLLDRPVVGASEDFFDLGGDSLLALRLVAEIERELGQTVPVGSLFPSATIEGIAARLRASPEGRPTAPVLALQPVGSRRPLFCVHPLVGSATCYRALSRHLGADQPLYGLDDPALCAAALAASREGARPDGSERLDASLPDLAAAYVAAVQSVQPRGPYALGGWSYGGIVAFEMARQLRRRGHEVALVALLDSAAPAEVARALGPADDGALAALLLAQIPSAVRPDRGRPGRPCRAPRRPRARAASQASEAAGLAAPWLDRCLRVWTARLRALREYAPPRYAGRVVMLRAGDGPPGPGDRPGPDGRTREAGWAALCERPIETHAVPGTHDTIVAEPNVGALAARLRACLDAAVSNQDGERGSQGW